MEQKILDNNQKTFYDIYDLYLTYINEKFPEFIDYHKYLNEIKEAFKNKKGV